MLKYLLKDPEQVIEKCISNTFNYLKMHPKDWANSKKQELTLQNVRADICKFFETDPQITPPGTVPDELVAEVLEILCGVDPNSRRAIQRQYNQQKQVEQKILGIFLELYILKHSFDFGWVQTGNCIRGTDMIKKNADGSWFKLQIKNSDNTTNSSSASFIADKALTWRRRNSTKGTQYWQDFPDLNVKPNLSEDGFKKFILSYYSKTSNKERRTFGGFFGNL